MKRSDSLYIRIAETLKERFSSSEYHDQFIPSEYVLQQEFQASRVTVRKALKLLEERGYIRTIHGRGRIAEKNGLAFPLNRSKPRNIACVCSIMQLPSYGIVCNTFNFTARSSGYGIQVFFVEGQNVDRIIKEISPENFAGIMCIGVFLAEVINELNQVGLPVVFAGYDSPLMSDAFCTDDFAGGFLAAEHLYSHHHLRVAVFGRIANMDPAFHSRLEGFMAFYRDKPETDAIFIDYPELGVTTEFFQQQMTGRTGLFLLSDQYHVYINQLMNLNKFNYKDGVNIVGYDNYVNNTTPPEYRTDCVAQPWEQMAEQSFVQLKAMIENPGGTSHVKTRIRPQLIINNSVKTI